MYKSLLLFSFFLFTPFLLIISLLFYSLLSNQKNPLLSHGVFQSATDTVAYAALPTSDTFIDYHITQKDARVELVRQFFSKYQSELEPFAEHVVQTADKYNIDFKYIPSIAMQESNLCKKIPPNSYNCWGFGIYGDKITRFQNYEEAIETVTKTLANNYIHKGLDTPEKIMKRYTPSSNGSWANGVNHFMEELQ